MQNALLIQMGLDIGALTLNPSLGFLIKCEVKFLNSGRCMETNAWKGPLQIKNAVHAIRFKTNTLEVLVL